jgi:hypothetical protein
MIRAEPRSGGANRRAASLSSGLCGCPGDRRAHQRIGALVEAQDRLDDVAVGVLADDLQVEAAEDFSLDLLDRRPELHVQHATAPDALSGSAFSAVPRNHGLLLLVSS